MNRLSRVALWLLLVPYFAVASMNAPAWIGETRRDTNRANAQLILALICVSPILFFLSAAGYLQRSPVRNHPAIFGLIVCVSALLIIKAWLRGDRETEYRREYRELSVAVRLAFGFATAALIVAGFMVFIIPA
jgi:uncharacterized membrane protein YfcA